MTIVRAEIIRYGLDHNDCQALADAFARSIETGETSTTQAAGDVMDETTLGAAAQELLTAILTAQSTTELRRRRDISNDAYGMCAANGDWGDAEIYREMSNACSDVLASRIIYRLTADGETEAIYCEWQRPLHLVGAVNYMGSPTFSMHKLCTAAWCNSPMINRQLAVTRSGKTIGYWSCPTHREMIATQVEDPTDPFMFIGPKAGQGWRRRNEIQWTKQYDAKTKRDAADILARLNKAVQL